MKKSLKICSLPTYNTYNNLAFAFSIIDCLNIDYSNWLLSHFINVYFRKSWDSICFRMPYCYNWSCFKKRIVLYNSNDFESFIKCIKKQIDDNRYVYLCINERYIPQRNSYKNSDFIHDLYIYGYDDDKNTFKTAAYNMTQYFSKQEIAFEKVYKAQKYKKIKNICYSFCLNERFNFEKPNKLAIKIQLLNYFFSINKFSGIHILDHLYRYYQNKDYIVMTRPKLLCEHIDVLSKLRNTGFNINCEKIAELSSRLFYLSIKYNLTSNKSVLNDAMLLIEEIKKKEIILFKDYFCSEYPKIISKIYIKKYKDYL